jgi:hypothetical protein
MAPKKPAKPAPKIVTKPASKPTAPTKKAKLTVWEAAPAPHAHNHHGHHHHEHNHAHGTCCDHDHGKNACGGMLACLTNCCPLAGILFTRSYWAAAVVAFIVIFASDWFLHTRFLMNDYAATSAFWRVDGEIRHDLIFATQVLTALVYAAMVIGLGHAGRWWGSFSSGVLAAAPVAICAFTSYVMLPFGSAYIPTVWAVASLLQGGLTGLAICAALHASRAPDVAGCCTDKPTLH